MEEERGNVPGNLCQLQLLSPSSLVTTKADNNRMTGKEREERRWIERGRDGERDRKAEKVRGRK